MISEVGLLALSVVALCAVLAMYYFDFNDAVLFFGGAALYVAALFIWFDFLARAAGG